MSIVFGPSPASPNPPPLIFRPIIGNRTGFKRLIGRPTQIAIPVTIGPPHPYRTLVQYVADSDLPDHRHDTRDGTAMLDTKD